MDCAGKIGVFGLHPAAGVTHVVMLLASYFSDVLKKKTEVLEADGGRAFARYEKFLYGTEEALTFRTKRCLYRRNAEGGIAAEHGRVQIFDFGCREAMMPRLFACGHKIIVGSAGLFHEEDIARFLSGREVRELLAREGTGAWHFLLNHGNTGEKCRLTAHAGEMTMDITAYGLGTEPNTLRLSKQVRQLFCKLNMAL
ncbi:MAG: hypothetical protein K2N94_09990 [Lachnospiraceae bacterium]|nr:hypothetical protein [Lachnospiraceae bacterium]